MSKDNIVFSSIPEELPESSGRDFSYEEIYGMDRKETPKPFSSKTTPPLNNDQSNDYNSRKE